MAYAILFVFGLAIGSFMNVLALRYDGERFLFDPKVIGGRSHCPHCAKTLRWYELVPVVSYLAQRGRCRNCKTRIGAHYPLVELCSGLVFAAVPFVAGGNVPLSAIWIAAFEVLILIAYIDLRLQIIPDELSVILGVLAIFETVVAGAYLAPEQWSFLGRPILLGPYSGNIWISHLAGAVFGFAFFALLALVTRGKGMGMGDVKLGAPLGFLFGWPDIVLLYGAGFVIGAVAGILLMIFAGRTRKSEVSFAPFLVAAAGFTYFFAAPAAAWYFRIIGL